MLSESLVDEEVFAPFPKDGKDVETMTVGEFVEFLLSTEKYCDITLPRITAAHRKMITERLSWYSQFRRRYIQNLEVLDRFEKPEGGVDVEFCGPDGEWYDAKSAGARSYSSRLVTVPVFRAQSPQTVEHVSLGMVICVDKEPRDSKDLTRSRGTSNKELLEKCREQQRQSAMATGKNYNKSTFRHIVRAGGVAISVGGTHDMPKHVSEYESDEEEREFKKRKKEQHEAQAKRAEIEAKYCKQTGSSAQRGQSGDGFEAPDRMRLG